MITLDVKMQGPFRGCMLRDLADTGQAEKVGCLWLLAMGW